MKRNPGKGDVFASSSSLFLFRFPSSFSGLDFRAGTSRPNRTPGPALRPRRTHPFYFSLSRLDPGYANSSSGRFPGGPPYRRDWRGTAKFPTSSKKRSGSDV